jgi:hypothetical protein
MGRVEFELHFVTGLRGGVLSSGVFVSRWCVVILILLDFGCARIVSYSE